MSLSPQVKVLQAGTAVVQIADNTGLYDAISNPGGWGAPNSNKTDVTGILVAIPPLSMATTGYQRLSTQDQTNYLYQGGLNLLPSNGIGFNDGVYQVLALLGFAQGNVLSSAAGGYTFSLTNANNIFANAIGFTIDSLSTSTFYAIDRTQPLTSIGGSVTTPLPGTSDVVITVYLQATINALVSQAGLACLNADIANFAGDCQCCEGEDLNTLLNRYAEYLAMNSKFTMFSDYPGADALARKLQLDCRPPLSPCSTQGLIPNVPFTGNVPVITTQPVNESVVAGAMVSFAVNATGTAPLIYQWYQNGILMPGQTGSVLTLPNVQLSSAAAFYCIVSNAYGSAQSNTVTLTVGSGLTPVAITSQPSNVSSSIGSNVSFSVTATGSPTITYQWYKNGTLISGATSSTLALTNIQAGDIAGYYCVVSNSVNSIQSSTATLSAGITAGWGWAATVPAQVSDLTSLQGSGVFTSGGTITADFRANTSPNLLIMYEPSTEPVKTRWFGDVNNQGPIGDPNNDLFGTPLIIGSYRAYVSVYKTLQTGEVIQFLVS